MTILGCQARCGDLGQNPTLRGRRLAMELQRRREATGMSREEVARQLKWSTYAGESLHGCASRLYAASMAFTLISGARHSLHPPSRAGPLTTPQASRHATDRIVAPPYRAFDAGLRPGPFPDRAASLLPGLLAATRTGLPPAGDDELTNSKIHHGLRHGVTSCSAGRTKDRASARSSPRSTDLIHPVSARIHPIRAASGCAALPGVMSWAAPWCPFLCMASTLPGASDIPESGHHERLLPMGNGLTG